MEMKSIILSTPLANSPPPPPSWQSTQSQSQCLPNRFTRVEELKIQSKILAGWPAGFKNTTELLEVQKPLGREEVDVREGMRSQEVVGNPFSHTQNSTSSPDQNNSKIERMAITSILSNSSHPESERHNGGCLPTATRQLGPLATGSLENASSNKRGPLDWKAIYHSQRQTTETCREQTNGRRRRGANLDWTDEERLLVKKLFDSDNPLRKVKEAYDKRFPGKNRSKEAIRRAHSRLKGKKTKKLPDKLLSPPKSTQVAYQAPSDVVLPSTATPSPETSKKAWLKRQLATMSDVHSESQISVSKNSKLDFPKDGDEANWFSYGPHPWQ